MNRDGLARHVDPGEGAIVASSGIDTAEGVRSASFLQKDSDVLFSGSRSDAVEITDIRRALQEIPEAKGYYGAAFNALDRDYPRDTEGGFFVRVRKGADVELPVQACLFLKSLGFRQKVHNIIVIEEGARAHMITGCSAAASATEGFHLGITEIFLKKDARLNSTMVHSWNAGISVQPLTVSILEEGAEFVSNYICLRPVQDVTMYPVAVLAGEGARAVYNSLVLSHPGCRHDIGSMAILRAENTRAEMTTRAVSLGGSVTARGHIMAESPRTAGHIECRGLILSEKGRIHAIPEMETDFRDVELSHEAAIGKIRREEIEYLCSRGFTPAQAQSAIVRGFMDVSILGLPEALKKSIEAIEEQTLKGGL